MSYELDALRYAAIYEEPAGSYAIDHSGTPGDFLPLPYMEGGLKADGDQPPLDPKTGKMLIDGADVQVLGPKVVQGSIAMRLHSHGLDLDGDLASPTTSNWALARLLKAIMGGMESTGTEAGQTTVQAGTTATAVTVSVGHGDRWLPGQVIACQTVSGSSNLEAREVLSIAGDVVSVKEAFSATPVTGTPVRGGVTFYLTEDPNTSIQLLVEGREGSDGGWFGGLQGGFGIELPLGDIPTLTWELQVAAQWVRLGSSGATIPSYSHYEPVDTTWSELTVPTVGSTTRVALEQSEMSFEPGITYAPKKSGRGVNTIGRARRQSNRIPIKVSWTVPYEDDTWYTAWSARQTRAFFLQIGQLAGKLVLLSAPSIQVVKVSDAADAEGIRGLKVEANGRHDAALAASSDRLRTALRLHFV